MILGKEIGNNSISINNIDKEKPTKPTNVELTKTINSITVKGVGGTDTLSGVAGYQYSLDNSNWSNTINVDNDYTFSELTEFTYTAYIRTVDNVGLVSDAYNLPVVLAIPVTGVSLNKSSTTIYNKATQTLTATVSPSNATNKSVTWKSSNNAVATVSPSGVVTGVKPGTATITVTTVDGGKTATCSVTISYPKVIYLGTGTSFNLTTVCNKYGISTSSLTVNNFIIGCKRVGKSGFSSAGGDFSSSGYFTADLTVSPRYSNPTFSPRVSGTTTCDDFTYGTGNLAVPVYFIPNGINDTSSVVSLGSVTSYDVSTICKNLGVDKTKLSRNNFVVKPTTTSESGMATTNDGTYLSNGYFTFYLCNISGSVVSYTASTGRVSVNSNIYCGSNTQTGSMMYLRPSKTFPLYFFPYGYINA